MSTQSFTPTEILLLEVLAARTRLGHEVWPVESRNARTVKSLEAKGMVYTTHSQVEQTIRLGLTAEGLEYMYKDSYTPPVVEELSQELAKAREELALLKINPPAPAAQVEDGSRPRSAPQPAFLSLLATVAEKLARKGVALARAARTRS